MVYKLAYTCTSTGLQCMNPPNVKIHKVIVTDLVLAHHCDDCSYHGQNIIFILAQNHRDHAVTVVMCSTAPNLDLLCAVISIFKNRFV